MCTGFEIAALLGTGLSAAGGIMQQRNATQNAQRQAEARNERLRNTLAKNDKLAEQSRAEFDQRQKQSTAEQIEADRQNATQQRNDTAQEAIDTAPAATAAPSISGSAPQVVQSEMAKRIQSALGDARETAGAQAKLQGYGDAWLGQGFQDVEAGRNIGKNANFAAGNMAILPYQQDIAEFNAYKPASPIGGILQGFGNALTTYGGSGGLPKKKITDPWAGLRGVTPQW